MTFAAILFLTTYFELTGERYAPHERWESEPMGFCITKCAYERGGISVEFETDAEPPYSVGVYRAVDVQFHSRPYPLMIRKTDFKKVFIASAPHLRKTVLVRVGKPEAMGYERPLTREEVEEYERNVASGDGYGLGKITMSEFLRRERDAMQIVGDGTWVTFLPGVGYSDMQLRAVGTIPQGSQDWFWKTVSVQSIGIEADMFRTNTVEGGEAYGFETVRTKVINDRFSATATVNQLQLKAVYEFEDGTILYSNVYERTFGDYRNVTFPASTNVPSEREWIDVPDLDESVGRGMRVVYFEDDDTYRVSRAYGARGDVSGDAILAPPFKSLSAHGGLVFGTDFLGATGFYANPGADEDVIQWEGIDL